MFSQSLLPHPRTTSAQEVAELLQQGSSVEFSSGSRKIVVIPQNNFPSVLS